MNNEPVAWMTAKGIQDVCTVNEKEEMGNDFDDYIIPLYTHPAKTEDEGKVCARCGAIAYDPVITQTANTLTDDIKYNVTVKWDGKTTHHKNVSDDTPLHYNEPKTLTDEEIAVLIAPVPIRPSYEDLDKFARAILRKAQEK